jgi:hypothetical protein
MSLLASLTASKPAHSDTSASREHRGPRIRFHVSLLYSIGVGLAACHRTGLAALPGDSDNVHLGISHI